MAQERAIRASSRVIGEWIIVRQEDDNDDDDYKKKIVYKKVVSKKDKKPSKKQQQKVRKRNSSVDQNAGRKTQLVVNVGSKRARTPGPLQSKRRKSQISDQTLKLESKLKKNQNKKNEEKEKQSKGTKSKFENRAKSVPAKPKKKNDSITKTKDTNTKSEQSNSRAKSVIPQKRTLISHNKNKSSHINQLSIPKRNKPAKTEAQSVAQKKESITTRSQQKSSKIFKFIRRDQNNQASKQEQKRAKQFQKKYGKGNEDLKTASNSFSLQQRQFKDKYDIVFILDTTGSMTSYLSQVVTAIGDIVKNVSQIQEISTKFACVSYTDHPPSDGGYGQPPVKYYPHDTLESDDNKQNAMKFIQGLKASGGGPLGGQAVVDGLHYANNEIPFREGSERMYILVLDQGPHGQEFTSFPYQFLKGCPCGISWRDKLREMKENQVEFLFVKIGNKLQKTEQLFQKEYGDKWSVMGLDGFKKFNDKIANYVCGLVRHNYQVSKKNNDTN